MSSLELLVCIILISISAFVSASETSLFSLTRFQLRSLKENFRSTHRKIKRLLSDPGGLLVTILVANEVLNIALSALIARALSRHPHSPPALFSHFPAWVFETLLAVFVTVPIILFLCDITPRVVAIRMNQVIATLAISPLTFIYNLFKPIRYILKSLIQVVSRKNKIFPESDSEHRSNGSQDQARKLKESEFLLMVEEGHKEGAIRENELELIRNVFELDNTDVSDVFTPISQVLSLSVNTTILEALNAARIQKFSRIPVTGLHKKDIIGILHTKDLLTAKLQPSNSSNTIAALIRKPYFITSSVRLNVLFRKLKEQKTHMAIVRSPNGEVLGVVTMSDVLDALLEDVFSDIDERKGQLGNSARGIPR